MFRCWRRVRHPACSASLLLLALLPSAVVPPALRAQPVLAPQPAPPALGAQPAPDAAALARAALTQKEELRAQGLAAQRDATARAQAAQAAQAALITQSQAMRAHLQQTEAQLENVADRMALLATRQRAAQARLAQRAADLATLLPLMQRLQQFPAETLLAVPAPPDVAVQGLVVMQGLARQLEQDARAVRDEQAAVAALGAQMAAVAPELQADQTAQMVQSAALDQQIAAARAAAASAHDDAAEAARAAAEDAAQASDLRRAIARIEADRRAAEARAAAIARVAAAEAARQKLAAEKVQASEKVQAAEKAGRRQDEAARRDAAEHQQQAQQKAEAARQASVALAAPAGPGLGPPEGQMDAPVGGRIIRAFGEPTPDGPANGLSYATAPGALVASPCAGRVAFAGPFRGFGLILILDCGGGYDFVLAGLQRLDVAVGQALAPGGPVGVMAQWDPRSTTSRPALYIELRHDGQPANPAPWFKAKG